MKMSQEGATFTRERINEIVDCPFIIIMLDKKGMHILCNRMNNLEANDVLRLAAANPINPDFET